MDRLPPFSALRALEAAVRLRSYSRAAEGLCVTHGAVSHQIRRLETEFGVRLFRREGAWMTPTPAAERLAAQVAQAIRLLESGVGRLRSEGRTQTLVLSVMPSFARRVLAPRLIDLTSRLPDLAVEIRAEDRLADFTTDGVDLAIRYGSGQWPGLRAQPLMREILFPVCSPAFADRHGLGRPEDLLRVPLLRQALRPWSPWFDLAGVPGAEPEAGLIFDDWDLLLGAAVDGVGVALAGSVMAERDLKSGRLVRPFSDALQAEWGYFAVWRNDSPRLALVERLRDWLVDAIDPAALGTA